MRLRNIPKADGVIAASNRCIKSPEALKGTHAHPLHIEIGMGKGRFITDLAALHPDIHYIGIERYTSVLLRAVEKVDEDILPNLSFLCFDAANITEIFEKNEVDKIYLNFSDPWPKARHANRRLTSPRFLELYHEILNDDGVIEFKTDNRALFDYSVEVINESETWEMVALTYDLHHDASMNEGNIMTEYEEKFSSIGNPICKYIIKKKQ